MTKTIYYRQKQRISKSKSMTDQKKESAKFNLWIDMIWSNKPKTTN